MGEADRLSDEGLALLEAGRYDDAFTCLQQARRLAPDDAQVCYRLGLLYGDTGRPAEALAAYDAALALDPKHARAHNNRGSNLQLLARWAEAEAAFRRAIALDPSLEPPYLNLGHLLELRAPAEAAALYEQAVARGLSAAIFTHLLAAARGLTTPRASDAWVRTTFDNFAPGFDRQLQALGYEVPQQLAQLLGATGTAIDIVDLGCGTGLAGAALAGRGHRMTGVDLSEKMLLRARERGFYETLVCAEAGAWLAGAPRGAFDAVIAADVFIYIGALEQVFDGVARVLRPRGRFAFSTEECAQDYALLPSGRYAQSQEYIARCAAARFSLLDTRAVTLRLEAGTPLAGRLYLFERC